MRRNRKSAREACLRLARAYASLSELIIQTLPVELGTLVAAEYLSSAKKDLNALAGIAGDAAREMHRAKKKGGRS